jgi:hypothetical protein
MAFCVFGQAAVNLIFFETFCKDVSRNKLRGSISFVFFGPIDQKLWVKCGQPKSFLFFNFLGLDFFL